MIDIVRCTTFKQLIGCDTVSSLMVDVSVFMEDPYKMLSHRHKKQKINEDSFHFEIELSLFIENCLNANPYYLSILSDSAKEWISEITHEYLDLKEYCKTMYTKEMVMNLMHVGEQLKENGKMCESVNTLLIAREMMNKGEVILPKNKNFSESRYESLKDDISMNIFKVDLPEKVDSRKLETDIIKLRKSVEYG